MIKSSEESCPKCPLQAPRRRGHHSPLQTPQIPGAWSQLTRASEGQEVNYTAALTRLGGLFYSNTLQESLQWARVPLLVASTYWLNHMAEFAPPEVAGMFRMTALVMAGVTFISAVEAIDPFH